MFRRSVCGSHNSADDKPQGVFFSSVGPTFICIGRVLAKYNIKAIGRSTVSFRPYTKVDDFMLEKFKTEVVANHISASDCISSHSH
jgi:hypothetical protein